MYITKVLSYNRAWEKLLAEYEAEFHELQEIFDLLPDYSAFIENEVNKKNKSDPTLPLAYLSDTSFFASQIASNDFNWKELVINPYANKAKNMYIGKHKNNFVVIFERESSIAALIYDKFYYLNSIADEYFLSVCILNKCVIDELKKNNINERYFVDYVMDFEFFQQEISRVLPKEISMPFLVFGLGFEPDNIEVIEVESQKESIMLERCITFEPEYYQAGLSILSYFGTILRDKYSDQNATVKIEQHDLTVRMVIQSENGNIETIEKALHEYELVLKGEINADEFYLSPIKALELKTQLRMFELQVESQKDFIALQNGIIIDLKQLASQALAKPPVTIINQLQNTQTTTINTKNEFTKSNNDLEELIDLADSDGLKNKLAMIQNALDINRNSDNPEDVKDSNGMKKLAKFLKEANEVGTEANSLAEKGGKALELIKSLGRSYNSIAQWCGMPIIPNVFVKE
ncbi:hypothetical protein AYK86_05625 [Acinetobacter venetianus]|uniref:hypothetical protein n=1 Tax=Acinetobacter venetianus TaxID=52133 RepID=UPI000775800A|nr:hypothetical protein [Acinetobacter venetianus]KXO85674.1 hypothetical protein AYK86_05625 [Acinetobacter venetianus]